MGKTEKNARVALLEETIEKAGGCGILDGGLATQLEKHGASINDPLWSALCLIKDPHLIKQVHMDYLEAGAHILVTSSYQASLPGFLSRGLTTPDAESLLDKSVKLAIDARDEFWNFVSKNADTCYIRALVAASIGSYGAYLADGSEYSGFYGKDIDVAKLKDFHRRRLQVLARAGPDLFAFETIPNKLETQAIVELLEEDNIDIPSWISFSSMDGEHTSSGDSFEECLDVINKSDKVVMTGINCSTPIYVDGLIRKFKRLTDKMIVVYPNSGEIWDGKAKRWLPPQCPNDNDFGSLALRWRDSGAKLIGGCCRTSPATIRDISIAFKGKP